jgi:hypothetical protein
MQPGAFVLVLETRGSSSADLRLSTVGAAARGMRPWRAQRRAKTAASTSLPPSAPSSRIPRYRRRAATYMRTTGGTARRHVAFSSEWHSRQSGILVSLLGAHARTLYMHETGASLRRGLRGARVSAEALSLDCRAGARRLRRQGGVADDDFCRP